MANKILMIDDEPDAVVTTKFILETYGFEVVTAYDGEEGIKRAKEVKPDLIILDMLMPKIFGTEVDKMLKDSPQTASIPVIFFSNVPLQFISGEDKQKGHTSQQDAKKAVYLSKLCSEEELIQTINRLLVGR